ncbi:MAG: hypothetical protein ACKO81_05890 [Planctomycetota bacterium]
MSSDVSPIAAKPFLKWFEVTLDLTGAQRLWQQWFKLREELGFTADPFQKGFGCDGADVG